MRRILTIVVIFIGIYLVYDYFFEVDVSPHFLLVNHTTKPISFSNLSLRANTNDYTYEELELAKYSYEISAGNSDSEYIDSIYSNNADAIDTTFSFSYINNENEEISDLEGAVFSDKAYYPKQLSHCNFIINIYPNATTVIYNDDNKCSRPMYYANDK